MGAGITFSPPYPSLPVMPAPAACVARGWDYGGHPDTPRSSDRRDPHAQPITTVSGCPPVPTPRSAGPGAGMTLQWMPASPTASPDGLRTQRATADPGSFPIMTGNDPGSTCALKGRTRPGTRHDGRRKPILSSCPRQLRATHTAGNSAGTQTRHNRDAVAHRTGNRYPAMSGCPPVPSPRSAGLGAGMTGERTAPDCPGGLRPGLAKLLRHGHTPRH